MRPARPRLARLGTVHVGFVHLGFIHVGSVRRAGRRPGDVRRAPSVVASRHLSSRALVSRLGPPSLLAAALSVVMASSPAAAATTYNWKAYLGGPSHTSYTTDAQITTANAGSLVPAWTWTPTAGTLAGQPKGGIYSTPAVYGHKIYIGANTGDFYALNESTGAVIWKRFIGFQPAITCAAQGFASTASVATITTSTGSTITLVYVAAPDGYLYALNAANGSTYWRSTVVIPSTTTNDAFNWSSPTIVGNHLYVGFSSNCDNPFIRGGLAEFDRTTGARLATFYSVSAGSTGGGIWTSAAANTSAVYVTTGSANAGTTGDVNAIVRLDPNSLARLSGWVLPSPQPAGDPDWGSSPTLFTAVVNGTSVSLVGACDKNGIYYAFKRLNLSAPYWQFKAGVATSDGGSACLAAAIFDGSRLFVAADETTINGVDYQGSLRRLDPATGKPVWELGLTANAPGSPMEDAAGVIAVATHDYIPTGLTNQAYLVDASTGHVLATFNHNNQKEFAQPVFADQYLLLTTVNSMYAYHP